MSKASRRAARAQRHQAATGSSGAAGTAATTTTGQRAPSHGPSGASRAGRRERIRYQPKKSFLERYRGWLLTGGALVGIALVAAFVFLGANQPIVTCTIRWEPTPSASPEPGQSNRLGYVQEDMGASHIVNRPQKYTYCPPASGNHYAVSGRGPIEPRVYPPDAQIGPPNWIHNLEHGGLVILYKGDQPDLAAFRAFADSLPDSPICKLSPGVISPVVARFDEMDWPFAALVWDRVLPMATWDPALATEFFLQEAERLDADGAFVAPPEPQCALPSPSPSAAPSDSAEPSPPESPAPSESAVPSESASASSAAPSEPASASPAP